MLMAQMSIVTPQEGVDMATHFLRSKIAVAATV